MDKQDQIIKKALQDKMVTINKPNLTEQIIEKHVEYLDKKKARPIAFGSIILGIIGAILGLALTFVNSIYEIGLSEMQLMIVQIIPIVYLFYQVLNEILINGIRLPKINQIFSSLVMLLIIITFG